MSKCLSVYSLFFLVSFSLVMVPLYSVLTHLLRFLTNVFFILFIIFTIRKRNTIKNYSYVEYFT